MALVALRSRAASGIKPKNTTQRRTLQPIALTSEHTKRGNTVYSVLRHVAQLPMVGIAMAWPNSPLKISTDNKRPVLFVHGYMAKPGSLMPMRLYFRANGHHETTGIDFESRRFTACVAVLRDKIRAMLTRSFSPDRKIDIVAHSLGGLLVRHVCQDLDIATSIRRVVTLGTPHFGTELANLGRPFGIAKDLRPDSTFITDIAHQLPWTNERLPELYALWSADDQVVRPFDYARVPGATNIEKPGFTHYSYLLRPDAWRSVFRVLS